MKNLVFQVNIKDINTKKGEGYIKRKKGFEYVQDLYSYSNYRAKKYADKVNADYFCLKDYWSVLGNKFSAPYHKFYFYELFKTYDKILYIDSDAFVTKICPDIFKLYDNFSAVKDFPKSNWGEMNTKRKNKTCKISEHHNFFCSGVMLLDKKFYDKTKDKWESTLDYWKDKTSQCDQTIQNIMIAKYYGEYNILEPDWGAWYRRGRYITHYEQGRRNNNTIKNFEKFEQKLI
tara:strand:+ start:50 stop:745 length:696 start_codon:yes stop_codon:yes gene_type:complete